MVLEVPAASCSQAYEYAVLPHTSDDADVSRTHVLPRWHVWLAEPTQELEE